MPVDRLDRLEEDRGLLDRHVRHLGDRLALVVGGAAVPEYGGNGPPSPETAGQLVGRARLRDRLDRVLAAEAVHHEQAVRHELQRLRRSGHSRGKLARSCVRAIEMAQRARRRTGG
jgi:hypothetical protein